MKAFPRLGLAIFLLHAGPALGASDYPKISSPFAELRKAPIFTAPALPLAKTWGVSLPIGNDFKVEKVYGRWVFGRPSPRAHMKPSDYSPPGWLFSRHMLLPGDSDTLSRAQARATQNLIYHARVARSKLVPGEDGNSRIDFLESLTLSRKTLQAFSLPESTSSGQSSSWLLPSAFAEEAESPSMGLSGADLSFLDQEIKVVQEKKKAEAKRQEMKKLKAPPPPL